MTDLDSRPGTYVLLLRSQVRAALTVGRLGELSVQQGYYLYVGSAFGSGGLQARVAHHIRSAKTPHWHIDYLRAELPIHEVWFSTNSIRLEHTWAEMLSLHQDATIPLQRFGASDCRCASHLFYFSQKPSNTILNAEVIKNPTPFK